MNKGIALYTAMLFSGPIIASETFDVDAFNEHIQSKSQQVPSMEDVRHAHIRRNSEIHRRRLEAIDNLMRKAQRDWETDVARMQMEFIREVEEERRDKMWTNMAYWLGLAGNTMMSVAEAVDSMEGQDAPNNDPSNGNSSESVEGILAGEKLRSTTTRAIELCEEAGKPCRVIGVETVIETWLSKESLPDTVQSTDLKRDMASTISKQVPAGIVCWSSESGCKFNNADDVVRVDESISNRNVRKDIDDEPKENEILGQMESHSELEAKKRVAKILWSAAEWSTPIPDLIVSFTGKNPVSGTKESRAGAAAYAAAGMFGPVGKGAAKGGRLIVKGGKIFLGKKLLTRANRAAVNKLIKSMEGRTGREVFGEMKNSIGANAGFRQLGSTGIRKALRKTPFIWDKHTIQRILDPRTKKLGINSPKDIINVMNNGKIYDAKNGSIAIQSITNKLEK